LAELKVSFLGAEFKNPIVAASAEPTANYENMVRVIETGAGGLVVKTMTDSEAMQKMSLQTRWRYLNERHEVCRGKIPRTFSFYGRTGLEWRPPEEWAKEVERIREFGDKEGCVIIGSIGGTTVDSWVSLAKITEQTGVKMMELNFGCPHPSQMENARTGMVTGQDKELAAEIVKAVSENVSVPISIKLTPQVIDVVEMARAVKEAGASAVTLINRFVGFVVNPETGKPVILGAAGVGGPWMKPLTLRWIYEVYNKLDMPITGTNGPYDAKDVVEFMMAGATTVQMCSVVMAKGYRWLKKTIKGFNEFLDSHGYQTAEEVIGIAAKSAMTYAQMAEYPKERAVVNHALCTLCLTCIDSCFYNALSVKDDQLVVRDCWGCGICSCVCPEQAITMQGGPVNE
jgi:dihydroorotate dehydrogenase (fumarate)/dihydropyrimidine dehydrogenase (NAD+) subunit PreA